MRGKSIMSGEYSRCAVKELAWHQSQVKEVKFKINFFFPCTTTSRYMYW